MLPGSPLLTVREVARLLAVSTFMVYGLIGSGRLPAVRISNAVRVRPEDMQALLRS
jgi:excisionase family DNA binding protein